MNHVSQENTELPRGLMNTFSDTLTTERAGQKTHLSLQEGTPRELTRNKNGKKVSDGEELMLTKRPHGTTFRTIPKASVEHQQLHSL